MPRNKKAARRGNSHATSRRGQGQGQETDSDFIQFDGASGPKTRGHNGFTLQEEARNTERHHSFWDTDQRLRHTKVNFVSAGSLEPTIPKDTESAMAEMTLGSPQNNEENAELNVEDDEETKTHTWTPQLQPKSPKQAWIFSDSFPNAQADLVLQGERSKASNQDRAASGRPQLLSPLVESSTQDPTYTGFFVDTHGTTPVNTGLSRPRLRSTSPTPSNSSEEVILFGGRDRQGRGLSRAPKLSKAPTDPIDAKIRMVEDKIHENEELLEHVLRLDDRAASRDPKDSSTEFGPSKRRIHRGRHNHKTRKEEEEEEAALIADYIANIDSDVGGTFKSFNQRELGGTEDEIWQETEESSGDLVKSIDRPFQAGWSRADICDFDDLSTSDGVMGDVQAIISKRDRETGVQYLVVWENQTVDEARWVPVATLISVNALLLIEKFEAEEKLVAEFLDSDEEDTSDSDDEGIPGESDDEDGEEDLIQRKISHISDEKIARLLAKQEELGMGSAEIMLFDGDAIEDQDEIQLSKHTFSPVMLPSRKTRARDRSAKRPRGEFPAAGLLANAYDGFDVMDFDRPSLKKKPKGRKGKLMFDLSDSELEASMQMAWDNDRIKKKERKQEREELRAQGLLGSKNSKPDLKQMYREGMGIDAIKEEIKSFLMGNNTTLSLPPMDKADRKVVHELAAAFNLKSKSAGSGPKRFPILYRTARTSVYVERTFDAVQAKLSRRYLPRMDVGGKRPGAGSSRVGKGGGFNSAAVSYRDGDIVGGSAPELGIENRGRAMLEKMGWSSGTALGALNNKGILEPVSHVVKTTKAGLG